jgi:hypothetical protein
MRKQSTLAASLLACVACSAGKLAGDGATASYTKTDDM